MCGDSRLVFMNILIEHFPTLLDGSKKASNILPFTRNTPNPSKILWCNETVGKNGLGMFPTVSSAERCLWVCNHQPGWLSPISSSSSQVVSWFLNVPKWFWTKQVKMLPVSKVQTPKSRRFPMFFFGGEDRIWRHTPCIPFPVRAEKALDFHAPRQIDEG